MKRCCSLQKILYLALMAVFVFALLFSTRIINAIHGNGVQKIETELDSLKKNAAYCAIDEITPYNDIFESIYIFGWLFCETEELNDDKEMAVILSNQSGTYRFVCNQMLPRPDVNTKLGATHRIRGENNGFGVSFSTLLMPNGLYDLSVYCQENSVNYGVVSTEYQLLKDKDGMHIRNWQSTCVEANLEKADIQDVIYTIEKTELTTDGALKIAGWATAPGVESLQQTVYIRITYSDSTSIAYTTQSKSRPDVGTAYGNEKYNNSGFWAVIPKEDLISGEATIEVIINNEDWTHASTVQSKIFIKASEQEK